MNTRPYFILLFVLLSSALFGSQSSSQFRSIAGLSENEIISFSAPYGATNDPCLQAANQSRFVEARISFDMEDYQLLVGTRINITVAVLNPFGGTPLYEDVLDFEPSDGILGGIIGEKKSEIVIPICQYGFENDDLQIQIVDGVTELSNMPESLQLEFKVTMDDVFDAVTPSLSLSDDGATFIWDMIPGTDFYELQWVHFPEFTVLEHSTNDPFTLKEPVTIVCDFNIYYPDIMFEKGTVYYRVRAIGKNPCNDDKFSDWSNVATVNISTTPEANKNWAYSATYAENAKHKSVISYHDGLNKNRQSNTFLSSENTTLIAESVYDKEGRPAVSLLPTPVPGKVFDYQENLNLDNNTGTKFSAEHFDGKRSPALSNTSGTAKYYSPNNEYLNDPSLTTGLDFSGFVPDANGYPYSRNTYVNDNTGRLRSSSMPGEVFATGNMGKETRIYYPSPTSTELHAMFGDNVGDVSHYTKQIMVDPNGVINVSYNDMYGRTVATCLKGMKPENLESVSSNTGNVTFSLDDNNNLDLENRSSVTNFTVFNPETDGNSVFALFNYELEGSTFGFSYEGPSGGGGTVNLPSINIPCTYDLVIRAFSPKGQQVDLINVTGSNVAVVDGEIQTVISEASIPAFSFQMEMIEEGEYTIEKTLTLNVGDVAFDAELLFLQSNTSYTWDQSSCIEDLETLYPADGNILDNVVLDNAELDQLARNSLNEIYSESTDEKREIIELYTADMLIAEAFNFNRLNSASAFCTDNSETLNCDEINLVCDQLIYSMCMEIRREEYIETNVEELTNEELSSCDLTPHQHCANEVAYTPVIVNNVETFPHLDFYQSMPAIDYTVDLGTITGTDIYEFVQEVQGCVADMYQPENLQEQLEATGAFNCDEVLSAMKQDVLYDPVTETGRFQFHEDDEISGGFWERVVDYYANETDCNDAVYFPNGFFPPYTSSSALNKNMVKYYIDQGENKNEKQDRAEEIASSIVPAHREYCHYMICRDMAPSLRFDASLSGLTTWSEAASGTNCYLNPLGLSSTPAHMPEIRNTGVIDNSLPDDVEAIVQQYFENYYDKMGIFYDDGNSSLHGRTLWDYCFDFATATDYNITENFPEETVEEISLRLFKATYTEVKRRAFYEAWNNGSCNDCNYITDDDVNPVHFKDDLFIDEGEDGMTVLNDFIANNTPLIEDACDAMQVHAAAQYVGMIREQYGSLFSDADLSAYQTLLAAKLEEMYCTQDADNSIELEPHLYERVNAVAQLHTEVALTYDNSSTSDITAVFDEIKTGIVDEFLHNLAVHCNFYWEDYPDSDYDNAFDLIYNSNSTANADEEYLLPRILYGDLAAALPNIIPDDIDCNYPLEEEKCFSIRQEIIDEVYWNTDRPVGVESYVELLNVFFSRSSTLLVDDNLILPTDDNSGSYRPYYQLTLNSIDLNNSNLSSSLYSSGTPTDIYMSVFKRTSIWDLASNSIYDHICEGFSPIVFSLDPLNNINGLIAENGACNFDFEIIPLPNIISIFFFFHTYFVDRNLNNDNIYVNFQSMEFNPLGIYSFEIVANMKNGLENERLICSQNEFEFYIGSNKEFEGSFGDFYFQRLMELSESISGFSCDINSILNLYESPSSYKKANLLGHELFDNANYNTYDDFIAHCNNVRNSRSVQEYPCPIEDVTFYIGNVHCVDGYRQEYTVWPDWDCELDRIVTPESFIYTYKSKITCYYFNGNGQSYYRESHVVNGHYESTTTCHTAPVTIPEVDWLPQYTTSCRDFMQQENHVEAVRQYNEALEQFTEAYYDQYLANAFGDGDIENFNYQYNFDEYQYTLYYYDQAGNLVQTVPPQGFSTEFVDELTGAATPTVLHFNGDGSYNRGTSSPYPDHSFKSSYKYNSLNLAYEQNTPDANTKKFWYNNKGQLRFSQTAEQFSRTEAGNLHVTEYNYNSLGDLTLTQEMRSTSSTLDDILGYLNIGYTNFPGNTYEKTSYEYNSITSIDEVNFIAENTRNRIGKVSYYPVHTYFYSYNVPDISQYYSYDEFGNVKTIVCDFYSVLQSSVHTYKRIDYEYDLLTGNVTTVWYQRGESDQFIHRYSYDSDNRLTTVETSHDGIVWYTDAEYMYYKHGPLARMVLGHTGVQGVDYAYTLQGWLKGVNSEELTPNKDMAHDGLGNNFPADVYGFSLNYYKDEASDGRSIFDYTAIGASVGVDAFQTGFADEPGTDLSRWRQMGAINPVVNSTNPGPTEVKELNLYNGNIASMVSSGYKDHNDPKVNIYKYQYDQLNRIKRMEGYQYESPGSVTDFVRSDYDYDKNGNIKTLNRGVSTLSGFNNFDELSYYPFSEEGPYTDNKLNHVADGIELALFNDITTQALGNYTYDMDGNLTNDKVGGLSIVWNHNGKITSISKDNDGDDIADEVYSYKYDGSGNRIQKTSTTTGITLYVRDASGNIMATYNETSDGLQPEHVIYGSSRLGTISNKPQTNIRTHGLRKYELTNHLGNVMAVVTDYKKYTAGVASADLKMTSEYYPFGMKIPEYGIQITDANDKYRFGFQGQEEDKETGFLNFTFRMYDPRIVRFFAVDPIAKEYPELTPYQFASNNPIWMKEIEGLEGTPTNKKDAKEALDKAVETDAKNSAEVYDAYTKNATPDKLETVDISHLRNDVKNSSILESSTLSRQYYIDDQITEEMEDGSTINYSMQVVVPIAQKEKTISQVTFTNDKKYPNGVKNPWFGSGEMFYVEFWTAPVNEGKDSKRVAVYAFANKEDFLKFKREKWTPVYERTKAELRNVVREWEWNE